LPNARADRSKHAAKRLSKNLRGARQNVGKRPILLCCAKILSLGPHRAELTSATMSGTPSSPSAASEATVFWQILTPNDCIMNAGLVPSVKPWRSV
jgi:hypothetical protein